MKKPEAYGKSKTTRAEASASECDGIWYWWMSSDALHNNNMIGEFSKPHFCPKRIMSPTV